MTIITLAEAKRHLSLPVEETFQDPLISTYIAAAEDHVSAWLNRPLAPWDPDVPMAAVPASVKQGILLVIGDLYANREAVAAGVQYGDNPTLRALLGFWRLNMGV